VTTTPASPTDGLPSLVRLAEKLAGTNAGDPENVKACCAAAYGLDVVALLLGESYHPGGADLTRRLADAMELRPGARLLDVAAGIGTTALLLAEERGIDVIGIDLGEAQAARARSRVRPLGLDRHVTFAVGDAERLPLAEGGVDAVVCECALCTFPNKDAAAAELVRVLRPGGRLGISDVWLDPQRLDPELRGLAARVACLADARPIAELTGTLERAGLTVTHVERHDAALLETIEQVETRLRALRIADLPWLRGLDLRRAIGLARRTADAVQQGEAGYMLLVAGRPPAPPGPNP
jgi:arsenite methyltransferase